VNRNQLEPSPQELPVKDTDRVIDVASAEREYFVSSYFNKISYSVERWIACHEPSPLSHHYHRKLKSINPRTNPRMRECEIKNASD